MRLSFKRDLRDSGICFAWLPVLTDEGKVWLEHVHFHWVEGWGWGSDGYYEYRRLIPEHRYNGGERAQAKWHGLKHPADYQTPPGDPKAFCKNYRDDGPTPCHFPNCKYLDEDGVTIRCGVDRKAFGDWAL